MCCMEPLCRLRKEFLSLTKSKPHGIQVALVDDNMHHWQAVIPGPPSSHYAGGKFRLDIRFPDDYPLKPPHLRFTKPIYHLNVSQSTGELCFGFLSEDNWAATVTTEQLLQAVFSLMITPEPSSAYDHDLLNNFYHFAGSYAGNAKQSAKTASI